MTDIEEEELRRIVRRIVLECLREYLISVRRVRLDEVGELERVLNIKPTTAELRKS